MTTVSAVKHWGLALAVLAATGFVGASAQAAQVPVAPGDFTGSRSVTGGGVDATGNWANGFEISWDIELDGGVWTYNYFIELGEDVVGDPSHFLLETSPTFGEDNILDANGDVEGPDDFTEQQGNPNLPEDVYGLKFDFQSYTYTLETDRSPIWGDFYTKDGDAGGEGINTAWNSDFGVDVAFGGPFGGYIPVPDTNGTIIPIPGAVWLGLAGLGAVAVVRRKFVS